MKTHRIKKLMIAGTGVRTNNKDEMSENDGKIVQLWDDYVQGNIYNKTFNKSKEPYLYGVYSNYDSDLNGDYTVTVGVEVTKSKNAIVIEDQKYLVFKNKGDFPEVVIDTWDIVWKYFEENDEYERMYTIDFEKYVSETELEIYIAIK